MIDEIPRSFPRPSGSGLVEVNYPFVFGRGSDAAVVRASLHMGGIVMNYPRR